MPVIPANMEADGGVSQVQGQPGQLSNLLPQNVKVNAGLGIQPNVKVFVWNPEAVQTTPSPGCGVKYKSRMVCSTFNSM